MRLFHVINEVERMYVGTETLSCIHLPMLTHAASRRALRKNVPWMPRLVGRHARCGHQLPSREYGMVDRGIVADIMLIIIARKDARGVPILRAPASRLHTCARRVKWGVGSC